MGLFFSLLFFSELICLQINSSNLSLHILLRRVNFLMEEYVWRFRKKRAPLFLRFPDSTLEEEFVQ